MDVTHEEDFEENYDDELNMDDGKMEEKEEDSSESEDPTEWTEEHEVGFLRTLSAVKSKDPRIYNKEVEFFNKNVQSTIKSEQTSSNKKKPSKMTLRDYERKVVLERGGKFSDDEEEGDQDYAEEDPSNIELQNRLKQEFNEVLKSDDSDDEFLLKKREKTEEEKKKEDEDFYEWLKGEGSLNVVDEDLKKLKTRWSKTAELDNEEIFLRDYLLQKKYVVDDAGEEETVPSYDEIVQNEEEEEKAEEFEHKYNFRFEEPDQEFIKQYPRTIKNSIRESAPNKRKEAKKLRRQRKLEKKHEQKLAEAKAILEANDDDIEGEDRDEDGTIFKFHYRSVPANDFGLTTDEILTLDDKQLNAWAPIKKVSEYKTAEEEQNDIARFQRKAKDPEKKKRVFKSVLLSSTVIPTPPNNDEDKPLKSSKKKAFKKSREISDKPSTSKRISNELDSERLKAYGVSTKKLKRLLYNKKQDEIKLKTEQKVE